MAYFALFADLENCGGKKSVLMDVIERVKIRGDILIGKVYGYTDSYSDLKEILLSNTFAVVPSLRYGRSQKNSMDIQLVIDALDVAFTNPLIDSFCIVSGDSDYVPLVGKLKSMGKFVLGISRSEAASNVFMSACSEFQFLESVSTSNKQRNKTESLDVLTLQDVNDLLVTILKETDSGEMLAAEAKNVLLRLRPNFSEKSVGYSTFGKLVSRLSQEFGEFSVVTEQYNVKLRLAQSVSMGEQLTKDNYVKILSKMLSEYKRDGFDRVNPSILKASLLTAYPDFTERQIGHRRFSDVLRALEKEHLLRIEMDESGNMLVRIL